MLKSKLSIAAYILIAGTLLSVVAGSCLIASEFQTSDSWFIKIFCLIPISWICLVAIWGEVRRKCIGISTQHSNVLISSFGFSMSYDITYFDGYITCPIFTSGKTYEEIYLMKDKKRIVTIASFYISNYSQIKRSIEGRMFFIGEESYSLKRDMIQIFK